MEEMLRRFLLCFCLMSHFLAATTVKETISSMLPLLSKVEGAERSALQLKLAIAYVQDQDSETAFSLFLDALEEAPKKPVELLTAEEQRLYESALSYYLSHQGPAAHRAAKTILEDYEPILQQNPNYFLLGLLVASAHANLQQYESFFSLFYTSYQRYPEHFLSYKTQALINHKLWQMGKVPGEREAYRSLIKHNIEQAVHHYPNDPSLYKMLIAFSNEREKPAAVALCLNNIVRDNIIMPREDILFFVQAGVSTKNRELSQKFVDTAKSWYKQSRALTHAQELIDSQGSVS